MSCVASFFFFNDTATTEIYTLSLHDALPILAAQDEGVHRQAGDQAAALGTADGLAPAGDLEGLDHVAGEQEDRKSTRLNSSHANISYAVFCLKKKKDGNAAGLLWSFCGGKRT